MSGLVSQHREGEIGVITLNNPPVNALGPALLAEIRQALEELRGDDSVRGVVVIGGGRAFSGGADINEFGKVTSGQATPRGLAVSRVARGPGAVPQASRLCDPRLCLWWGTRAGDGLSLPRR